MARAEVDVPDELRLFVGPATAPDAYELNAEVDADTWRARTDRLDVIVAAHAGGEPWDGARLTALSHPGVARIRAAFAGAAPHARRTAPGAIDRRYVVSDDEHGETLRDWLTANPDASLTDRAHLLRQVGAALDGMRAASVTHGRLTTDTVIVRPDRSAIVVGIRDSGTPADDVLAFALLAAETFTGQRVDAASLARTLRTNVRTRRHPVLIRALAGAVSGTVETRPRQLRRWLDEALEPQRQTVTGDVLPAPDAVPGTPPPRRRTRFAVALVAVLLAATGLTVYLTTQHGSSGQGPALTITDLSWPVADGCSTAGDIAMPAGSKPPSAYVGGADPRVLVSHGAVDRAGAWVRGALRFTLVSHSSGVVFIEDMQARLNSADISATPPAWVYRTVHSGCTPTASGADRSYVYRLGSTLRDAKAPAVPVPAISRFALAPGHTVTLVVDVSVCQNSASWQLSLTYVAAGHRSVTIPVGGKFYAYATARHTPFVDGKMSGGQLKIVRTSHLSTSVPQCTR